jgi:hypothetical protein
MIRRERRPRLIRLLKDLFTGLSVVTLMLLAASAGAPGGSRSIMAEVAHASEVASSEVVDTLHMIDAELALSEPIYRGTDRGTAILILALVFSSIVVFNLWFFRHLHRVYADPRRGGRG